jgi:methanogenic corrinoid protein MtbC1
MDSRLASPWPFMQEGDFAPTEIERTAHACLQSLEAVLAQIEHWRQAGQGLEDIYIHGLAPTARLLGHWWCCDTADFAQVTIGSSNLQRVLHRLSPEFCAPGADQPKGLSLLLATEPQSQHTMGAFMLAEFFRRHGWTVQLLSPQDGEEVLTHLHRDWFDAVALSVSSDRQLQTLAQWLPQLRVRSPNPLLHVLVGGPMVMQAPEALRALGVDLAAADARQTVNWLSQQVMTLKS